MATDYAVYVIILVVLLLIIIILSVKTEMLRNSVFNPIDFQAVVTAKGLANPRAGFSLARTQLAFWSVIVIGSFIYVFFFHDSSAIDAVNLTLLGVAAGTTVVGKVIDSSQQNNPAPKPTVPNIAQQNNPVPQNNPNIAQQNNPAPLYNPASQINPAPQPVVPDTPVPPGIAQQNQPSKGFFTDIISDQNGVSIHRLQNVLWTIVVGAIYILSVSKKHELPTNTVITPELLGLMGISAAAYLGVKTNENT